MTAPYVTVEQQNTRTRAVHDLVDALPLRASLYASETRVGYPGKANTNLSAVTPDAAYAVYDAIAGAISYLDLDGVRRTLAVPVGATPEAIASLLYALATTEEWSQGQG